MESGDEAVDMTRLERRSEGAPLPAPLLAFDDEQTASDNGLEEPPCRRFALVTLPMRNEQLVNVGGVVEQEVVTPEQASMHPKRSIIVRGPNFEQVATHRPEGARRGEFAQGHARPGQ